MTPIRQPPITVSSVPFQAGRVSIAPNRSDNDQAISYRIAALEAGRQDLSAWATLLGCVISMILAANVGLSVWQVRNLTQIQVDKLRTKYDKQFSGFLTHSQENLAAKIADYETNIAELTSAIDNMTPMFDGYITETAATVAKMHREIELALERLRKESEIIRQSIEGS
jgi:hypothetical protein